MWACSLIAVAQIRYPRYMPTRRAWLLLLLAITLRLLSQGWDAGLGNTPHPDERQVGYVSERLEGWFDDPEFYAYGSLHFQAVRAATARFEERFRWIEDHIGDGDMSAMSLEQLDSLWDQAKAAGIGGS